MNHNKKEVCDSYPNKRLEQKLADLNNVRWNLKQATQRLKAQNDRLEEKLRK